MAKSPLFGALEQLARSHALEPATLGILGAGRAPNIPAPVVPTPAPVVPLPDQEDPSVLAARRLALLRAAGRSGRASTDLATQQDYSTDKTGVA